MKLDFLNYLKIYAEVSHCFLVDELILNDFTKSVLLCTDNKVTNVLRSFYSEFVGIFLDRNYFLFLKMNTDSFCESFSRYFARFFKRVYKKRNFFVNNEFDKKRRLFKEQFRMRSMMQFQVNVIM